MPVVKDLVFRLFAFGLETSDQAQQQSSFIGIADEEEVAIRSSLRRLGEHLFAANPTARPSKLMREFLAAGLVTQRRI
jgi:hypothetical protein